MSGEQAIAAIGSQEPDDYRLELDTHALRLKPEAGPLRRVLERPEIAHIIERFETADRAAIRWQRIYRWLSKLAFFSRFLAITVGALLLLRYVQAPVGWQASAGWLPSLGLGVEYSLIALSFLATLVLAIVQPFEKWMQHRGFAENARIDLFDRVLALGEEPRAGELPLLPLQLEYFRRYQLAVQRLFYRTRGAQHARAAGQTAVWRWITVALLALAAIPATLGMLATWWPNYVPAALAPVAALSREDATHTVILVLGIVATALAGLVSAISLSNLNHHFASRYEANADNLDFLGEKYLVEARKAAADGDRDAVADFVGLVQMQISSLHRDWVHASDLAQGLTLENFAQVRMPGRRHYREAASRTAA